MFVWAVLAYLDQIAEERKKDNSPLLEFLGLAATKNGKMCLPPFHLRRGERERQANWQSRGRRRESRHLPLPPPPCPILWRGIEGGLNKREGEDSEEEGPIRARLEFISG